MTALGDAPRGGKMFSAAVGLTALSSLLLEISLTRLFSFLYYPPAVFAILSIAILGISIGAALVTWRSELRPASRAPLYLLAAALSICALAVVSTMDGARAAALLLIIFPYIFIGMLLTVLFARTPGRSPELYRADLLGAGAGALLAVPLLNLAGGLNTVLATAVLLALAALLLAAPAQRLRVLAVFLLLLLAMVSNVFLPWLQIDPRGLPADKPLVQSLAGERSRVVATTWDAFTRTDLVDPGDGGPYRLYMDGAAGSVMPPAETPQFLYRDVGFFPFATEQPERVFVIGPGGGLDVWFGLESGAREIVAVEVNPGSVDLVREYADYNGDLYDRSAVTMQIDDGRSALRRDDREYDLIFFSQLVTQAAERGGYALVENSVFTVEAFQEFLDHLSPDGQLGIKLYDEPTLTRALSITLAAFRRRGMTDQEALQHVIVILDDAAQPPIPLLLISRSPFSQRDAVALGRVAQEIGFTPLFLPGVIVNPPLTDVAEGREGFSEVIASMESDFSAPTDNRPFFYQFERGIPRALQPLLWGIGAALLLGAAGVFMVQRRSAGPYRLVGPLYFAGLGAGFIMIEIGIIQQSRLFLGHPTTAVTVVLATLLVSGGLGSGMAGRFCRQSHALQQAPLLGIIVGLALWLLLWPRVGAAAVGLAPTLRIAVVVALLLPLGFLMGMPFPLGLRAVAGTDAGRESQVALAWAVNGLLSVVGTVLAVAIAIRLGYTAVLLTGGLAYALSAMVAQLRP